MKRNWETLQDVLESAESETLEDRMDELAKLDDKINAERESRLASTLGAGKARRCEAEKPSRLERDFIGHLWLAADAGLINGVEIARINAFDGGYRVGITKDVRLTMQGHDVLDGLRNEKISEMIKETTKAAAVPLTVDMVKAVLSYAAKQAVSIVLGNP